MTRMKQLSQSSVVRPLAAFVALALSAVLAHAHPGHGLHEASAAHVVTSPYHLLMLGLGGALLWGAGVLVKRQLTARLLKGAGALMAIGAVLIWGAAL